MKRKRRKKEENEEKDEIINGYAINDNINEENDENN